MTRKRLANLVRWKLDVADRRRFKVHARRAGGRCVVDVTQRSRIPYEPGVTIRIASAASWARTAAQTGIRP